MRDIPDILDRLVRYERAPLAYTKRFRSLQHNMDLCPRLQLQAENVLRAYGKYQAITYDTQGLNDGGSDVVVSFPDPVTERARIAFQVKSYSDLEHPHWFQQLKAQHSESIRRVKDLSCYYIFICTDQGLHRNKVRQISSEFGNCNDLFVIEPQYAWTFLTFPEYRLEAHVKRSLDDEDAVLRDARDALDLPTPTAKVLTIHACATAVFQGEGRIRPDELMASAHLRGLYAMVLDGVKEQIASDPGAYEVGDEDIEKLFRSSIEDLMASDLELLTRDLFASDSFTGTLTPDMSQLMPIVALLSDSLARFGATLDHSVAYVTDLLAVPLPSASPSWELSTP